MTAKNRTDLNAELAAADQYVVDNITTNGANEISGAEVNQAYVLYSGFDGDVIDSNLNLMETTAQVVAGPVKFSDSATNDNDEQFIAKTEFMLTSKSFTPQNPTGLDTPQKIVFSGVDASSPNGEVTVRANGDIEINVTGSYEIALIYTLGRSSGSGESEIVIWGQVNGSIPPDADTIQYRFDNNRTQVTAEFDNWGYFTAGTVISGWFARDSSGTNDGGLAPFSVSGTLAGLGISDVPSARITVHKMV